MISLYLSADDFLMIHETLAPIYIGLGDTSVYVAIGLTVSVYLVVFRRAILALDYLCLLAALTFLFCSILFDEIFEILEIVPESWGYFFEDGFKWLGIVLWAGFHISAAHELLGAHSSREQGVTN
jgi:hypothetical protein